MAGNQIEKCSSSWLPTVLIEALLNTYTHKYKIKIKKNSYIYTHTKLRHKAPRFKIYIIQITIIQCSMQLLMVVIVGYISVC